MFRKGFHRVIFCTCQRKKNRLQIEFSRGFHFVLKRISQSLQFEASKPI